MGTTAAPSPTTAAPNPTTAAPSPTTAAPSPPPSTEQPTEAPTEPPSGCGNDEWKGDGYCDDDNNNDACDYDGGDCCGNHVNTYYCTECECLDPDEQPEDDCEDIGKSWWCQRKKNQGKCNKWWVKTYCQKTCFNCEESTEAPTEAPTEPPCQDNWSTSKCENKKNSWTKPCNWNWWVKHNCKKTCGLC